MTKDEIEHMWKVASNNPNHDTNWHDPVVIAFAKLVEKKTRDHITNLVDEYDGWIADRIREDAGETIEKLPDVDRSALLQELLPEIQKTFNLAYAKYKGQE
jgi:hypothetical protein